MGDVIDVSPDALDEHAQAVTTFMDELTGATQDAGDLLDLRAFGIALIEEAQLLQIWTGAAEQFIAKAVGAGHQVASALTAMAEAYRAQEAASAQSFERIHTSLDEGNPLVAEAPSAWNLTPNFTTENNAELAGSGIFFDIAQTLGDSGWSLAIDLAADGLDLLGFVSDPFGVLLASAIGWIIEHIGFLKDALDVIAGDPDEVRAKARTWQNIGAALDKSGRDYDTSARTLASQQQGSAIDAYCRAADNYVGAVGAASSHAKDAAKAFEVAGAMVGTVRGLVRDNIAQFAADELIEGLVALAASPETFGGSIAAWIVATVGQATSLAARNAAKITRLVSDVEQLLSAAKRSTRGLEDGAREFDEGAKAAANTERGVKDAEAGASGAKRPNKADETKPADASTPAKTPEQQRTDAMDDIRRADSEADHAQDRADYETRAAARAQAAEDRAAQQLHDATTDAQREAARNAMWNAEARRRAHLDKADRAHSEVDEAHQRAAEARERYRDSFRVLPELPPGADLGAHAAKEAGVQGKESAHHHGEGADEAERAAEETDDGSLVPSGSG